MLAGKKITVLGAGRSGRAAARLAQQAGAEVLVCDAAGEASFQGMPEGVKIQPEADEAYGKETQSDILVVSPGIDTFGSYVKAFSEQAGEVIGETELAYRFYRGKIIAITGTNGKTTTTELVAKIMRSGGVSCEPCGNYGVPFSEIVMMDEVPQSVALEVSSFQMETIVEFKPDVAIWLNFSADHMDRYTAIEDYFNAKRRIFENQTESDFAVVRAGEDLGELKSSVVSFTTEDEPSDYALENGWITFRGEKLLDLSVTKLRGLHNAENAMAALAACRCAGVSLGAVSEALAGFAPPLHRCELIRTLDGVEYLNDSKATNLHALDSALRSQIRPVVLIAGGKQKGLDYSEIIGRLSKHAHSAVVYGEIADELAEVFSKAVSTKRVNNLDEAVAEARLLAKPGDAVLLSPGTSSFDQFKGYEDRGDQFRELVHALK
ncbi:UDP-N-acetylmuramoylalanine--D-glutamate ligase [Rubritalea halochordaticola]|uniref:UDP-N-acetylmuramoylalanine--D-glutamate ligase n=1 Tax=Rubritalea halochordaticola TaxID=714537 RepID=A0ABP9UY07_9BACT